jgi:tRNA pseudouridine55 synthase
VARKRRGLPIHGWIALDKPLGMTSTQAVGKVRWLLNAAKAGHGGTLDPLATGILPIALGEATKAVAYAMDGEKKYLFTARWGEARSTDDAEGEVVDTSDKRPTIVEIKSALPEFVGDIVQMPPAFSALKVNGKRAYDLARAGQEVELKPRTVTVSALNLVTRDLPPDETPDEVKFEVTCGKGTYIRALARDLARRLGTCGHLSELRRTQVGSLGEEQAICLDKLESMVHSAPPHTYLLPIATVLDDIPALAVTGFEADRLRCGQALRVPSSKQGTVYVMTDGQPVALARITEGELQPVRVFNLPTERRPDVDYC